MAIAAPVGSPWPSDPVATSTHGRVRMQGPAGCRTAGPFIISSSVITPPPCTSRTAAGRRVLGEDQVVVGLVVGVVASRTGDGGRAETAIRSAADMLEVGDEAGAGAGPDRVDAKLGGEVSSGHVEIDPGQGLGVRAVFMSRPSLLAGGGGWQHKVGGTRHRPGYRCRGPAPGTVPGPAAIGVVTHGQADRRAPRRGRPRCAGPGRWRAWSPGAHRGAGGRRRRGHPGAFSARVRP